MSAAVNDRPHEIVPLPHLPLTGELHPLRREFARWLYTGNMVTITLAVVVCATIYFWPRPAPTGIPNVIEGLVPGRVFQSPPPITPTGEVSPGNYAVDVGKGIIEPVPDDVLKGEEPEEPVIGNGGGDDPLAGAVPGPITGDGTVYIDPPAPKPSEIFTPFDTEPVLLSIDPPVYPQIVRDAGIDGQVLVRVFIALNGHVKDAYVVDGSPALREAALASARTAFFKPALAGTHPVEVWVVIPITFELRERY